jgi:ABC-type multidrug transport system fused ATPase/permease subunit
MTINGGGVVGIVINNKHERHILGEIICGLLPITNGSITWDGISLAENDITWPRHEMAYATPGDTIYPLSLKDNVMMGLDASQKRLITDQNLDLAARLCELSPIIDTFGWDYIPDGTTIVGNSVMPQPDLEAWTALNKHYPPPGISKLTEAQRFAIIL